jgi:alkylation response protein AidB-like acyl-CoA dehydrogenase
MQLAESAEQRQLRQSVRRSVRRFVAERPPLPAVRRLMAAPVRPAHRQLPGDQAPLRRPPGGASDAFFHIAAENIQIHGGIGFTWEHDAHLNLKRAKADELFLGDGAHHREQLATRIGL